MRKKIFASALPVVLLLAACGSQADTAAQAQPTESAAEAATTPTEATADTGAVPTEASAAPTETEAPAESAGIENGIEDGIYLADFNTDGSMFHVNEAWEGKGILTVMDGVMSIHLVMPSKNVLNLYPGLAEDAQKDGAVLLEPLTEEVTYSDGFTEEVYAFDLPVPVLDEEFDCALIGTKGKWYDHKVSVSDPEPYTDAALAPAGESTEEQTEEHTIEVSLEGGTGKASVSTPAKLTMSGGEIVITLEWSSPYYDYMIVDGIKYLPVNTEGNSVFEIPIKSIDSDFSVTADTTAMSKPHEIEYVVHLDPETYK